MDHAVLLDEPSVSKLHEKEVEAGTWLRDFELALVGGGIGDTVAY